ncbi:12409_t:CDS:2 [Entrophospora sp. SA101]|nr:2871_t:CDS:2 [Entrophospora sp. SA101]CAJ0646715.1 6537_t:CDS:2 [Entrophospora sp. SA101]CAJ0745022.1 12409_t:CDS:2 [Entrophospora sp. SA101]CAJ0828395.1 13844_t:CDS:2 [Entrophospora sp. SA101]CAJ0885103.1 5788_t:CDS:2 [Entrophospora sp. SA101]
MLQPSTIKRRLETFLNEFKRLRKNWDELNDECLTLANSFFNTKLQEQNADYPEYWIEEFEEFLNLKENYEKKMSKKVTELWNSLKLIFDKMIAQYTKMKIQILQMESLLEESCESLGEEFTYDTSLYLTCPLEIFVNRSITIFEMYTKELDLKQKIILTNNEIVVDREKAMIILSSWINQPFIDDWAIKEFENICDVEIGNKFDK